MHSTPTNRPLHIIGWLLTLTTSLTLTTPSQAGHPEATAPAAAHAHLGLTTPPWSMRSRIPGRDMRLGYGLIMPSSLPKEPETPDGLDQAQLARGLKTLCPARSPLGRKSALAAKWILASSKQFDVDPLIIGALVYRNSRCGFRSRRSKGSGPTRIRAHVHRRYIHDGHYHYWIVEDGRWSERELSVADFAFSAAALRRAQVNIYFTAALLSIYREQCRHLDRAFPGVPHRHWVSHFLWGDLVRGTGEEEQLLTDRRRLLGYARDIEPAPVGQFRGVVLSSPLDGSPRKITSDLRARRGPRGRRPHRGLDFYSTYGEPVKAVADGEVIFAGYSRRGKRARRVRARYSHRIRGSHLGVGGLFVLIRHKDHLDSGYFHLSRYSVRIGQKVRRGQLIGHVGRTGIKHSRPHLHFELRYRHRKINPMPHLGRAALPVEATHIGRRVLRSKRQRRAVARRHARQRQARRRRLRRRAADTRSKRPLPPTKHPVQPAVKTPAGKGPSAGSQSASSTQTPAASGTAAKPMVRQALATGLP